jgi:pimeloyl-ACP methyl ester carboxylesterase
MKFLNCAACLLALFFFSLSSVSAADLNREKRMADEIVDAILDGEAVFLNANDHEFLSIYTEADESGEAARGTAIILHGRGFHPDWQDAINPLRVGLAKTSNKVVLIAHSCGAHMAMAWADTESFESIDAYVGIGMGATDYKQPMKHPFPLDKIKVPVLDVYAENDYPAVLKMAAQRLRLIKIAANKKSSQVIVKGAEHYYVDKGEELTKVINQWLKSL